MKLDSDSESDSDSDSPEPGPARRDSADSEAAVHSRSGYAHFRLHSDAKHSSYMTLLSSTSYYSESRAA